MSSHELAAGDLIMYSISNHESAVGLVMKIYRVPLDVKMYDVVEAIIDGSRHTIPLELCVKING